MKNRLKGGFDLILMVSPIPADGNCRLQGRQEQLESLFKKAGLLK